MKEATMDIGVIRAELGLSKYALAKILKVSWNTVHLWERGVYKPSFIHWERILAVLKSRQKPADKGSNDGKDKTKKEV